MVQALSFVIYPDTQAVSLELLLKSVEDVNRLVRDVDYAITRERTKRNWVVVELHSSNPTITIAPLLGDTESIDTIVNGLTLIMRGTEEPPPYFTEQVLDDLKRMR